MNDEQINIAIEEIIRPALHGNIYRPTRDFCNDLNAMHEAENKLTPFQRIKHGHFLQETLNEAVVGFVSNYESELKSLSRVASATARQRAEAFLRTLRKWEETK
jgi:hypothetical protein